MNLYPSLEPIFQFLFLGIFLIPAFFYLLTLQNTLKLISAENRFISPGQVWFMLIPFFNIVWQFILINRLGKSIGAECKRLQIEGKGEKPTSDIGLAMCIFNCIFWVPILGSFGSLITWILHWVKVNEFKKLISSNESEFLLDAERNIFYGDADVKITHPKINL